MVIEELCIHALYIYIIHDIMGRGGGEGEVCKEILFPEYHQP
jgi:hypothetical protein